MATLEKLVKALEGLKILQLTPQMSDDTSSRRKDKIAHCLTIADTMCQSGIKGASNFSHLLSIAIEILLQLCDDSHSDVRMIADESLNRIIRAMADSNVVKIQVELHKEIKKNGNARTLRAALWRFAELCHMIRPQKGKPYVLNLVPCIVQIAKRTEEPVLETLAAAVSKIFKALGNFTTDNDIKSLLKAFLHNLSSPSAVVRRTAACSILAICIHCRKPHVFITYVMNTLLDCVVPLRENQPLSTVLGVLGCLRNILPHVASAAEAEEEMWGSFGVRKSLREAPPSVDRMIQVYELCLHFSNSSDHNVVVAALETLQQLLQSPPPDFLQVLLSSEGITRSRITINDSVKLTQRSLSQMSVAPSLIGGDESALLDSEPDPDLQPQSIEQWMREVQSVTTIPSDTTSMSEDPYPSLGIGDEDDSTSYLSTADEATRGAEYSNIHIGKIKEDDDPEAFSVMMTVTLPACAPGRPPGRPFGMPVQSSIQSEESRDETTGSHVSGSPSPTSLQNTTPSQHCEIGSFTDADIPLVFCSRHLASVFLLTGAVGYTMPDSCVRVSSKALALHCLTACLRLCPRLFFLPLDRRCSVKEHGSLESEHQSLSDVLLYAKHSDPQLRGITSLLVGNLLQSVLIQSGGHFSRWKSRQIEASSITLQTLIGVLLKGLGDPSSVCSRHTLGALALCLPELLESVDSVAVECIIQVLPNLANNPYWLVKVKLIEVLSELPYLAIYRLTKGSEFQDKILQDVLMILLSDEDARVRHAAAKACVRVVPHFFFPTDHPQQDSVTARGIQHSTKFISQLLNPAFNPEEICGTSCSLQHPNINSLPAPFNVFSNTSTPSQMCPTLEATLSRLVNLLVQALLTSSSKYLVYGSCEALSLLSDQYLTTLHPRAWNCFIASQSKFKKSSKRSSSSGLAQNSQECLASPAAGLLSISLSLLTASPIPLDLSCQCWLVSLSGNLFSGLAVWSLRPIDTSQNETDNQKAMWNILRDKQLVCAAEQLLIHLIRTLNVFVHVLEETSPVVPTPKPSLPSLPTAPSLSPIKRKSKNVGAGTEVPVGTENRTRGVSPVKSSAEKEEKMDEKRGTTGSSTSASSNRGTSIGFFANCPHYMKVYEVVRSAYTNYKITLDASASEKFVGLLRTTLEALSQLLEVATINEVGRVAEETLAYLRLTVLVEPTATVKCVQQLLKCLFGTNLSAQWDEAEEKRLSSLVTSPSPRLEPEGFYSQCFHLPYQQLTEHLATSAGRHDMRMDSRDDRTIKTDRKGSSMIRSSFTRGADKASLAAYIRLFEPMVIKALKQYTVTSDVRLQCRVLLLLCQLVQLRVNYCLLDSDQIFIGFVLKQFEFIEEGQIPLAEELVPRIFYFLVHLSYEKNHSKCIIGVPKVIQLCDGLMASGQPPTTHCIPALVPVVEDVFLARGSRSGGGTDLKELDTQREVLVSMLLRLVEYHQVLDLLSAVLSERESEERWRRWSRQVIDALLPLLAQGRVRLESRAAQQALHRLLAACAPSVLRPADPLLRVLFATPPSLHSSIVAIQRWLGAVLGVLLLLLAQGKEETVLARLEELDLPLPPSPTLGSPDPLNARSITAPGQKLPPEQLMARFLLRVIGLVSHQIHNAVLNPTPNSDWHYLHEQFSNFMLYCIYMFESGSYCRVATAAIQMLRGESCKDSMEALDTSEDRVPVVPLPVENINSLFYELAPRCPMLTVQWCYLLALLGYNNQSFWASIMRTQPAHPILGQGLPNEDESGPSSCVNLEVVRKGGTILFCDYVCENLSDAQQLTWLLVNHIEEVVRLSIEPPVHELVAAVNRSSAASGLLVQAVAARCQNLLQPSFAVQLLRCLQSVHPSQSGALLTFLVPRLLAHPHVAVARLAASLACRRAELLLTLSPEEVTSQLGRDDLQALVVALNAAQLANKHSGLLGVLTRLGASGQDPSPPVLDPDNLRTLHLDKEWFLAQVKLRCCHKNISGAESAQLLSKLEYDDILGVLHCPDFNTVLLRDCIQLGTLLTLQAYQSLPEPKASYSNENYLEIQQKTTALESPLYTAARLCLLEQVANICSLMPRPHQVFCPVGRPPTPKEAKYASRLQQLLGDKNFMVQLFETTPAVTCYLTSLPTLAWGGTWPPVPPNACEDLAKFGVLCLEIIHGLVRNAQENPSEALLPHHLEQCLACAEANLREPNLSAVLGMPNNVTWMTSAVGALTSTIDYLLEGESLPDLPAHGLKRAMEDPETVCSAHACHQMAILVLWLEKTQNKGHNIPAFLASTMKSLIVSLARMPLVNSYVVTPPDVWNQGWAPELTGPAKTTVPPLPVECLQDIDVLQQLVFRMTLLGWTSRQQFEETWMALLSVLSASPAPATVSEAAAPPEEAALVAQAAALAVQALTALLVQTLLLPLPGRPGTSVLLHQPRARAISLLPVNHMPPAQLRAAQELLLWPLRGPVSSGSIPSHPQHVFQRSNPERINNPFNYGYSQVSLDYIWTATRMMADLVKDSSKRTVSAKCLEREQCLAVSGLDLHSCLHFLLDLYSQWTAPQSGTPLRLMSAAVCSVLAISDLFTERAQFTWMLATFLELSRLHPMEDEILHQYLVLGACKAAAVLMPEPEINERVRRVLEGGLRSAFLPARLAGLHGILYLLQAGPISSAGSEDGSIGHIVASASEYIQRNIAATSPDNGSSEEHTLLLWALIFFVLEAQAEEHGPETEGNQAILHTVLNSATAPNLLWSTHVTLLQGLERLVAVRAVGSQVAEQVSQLAVEKLRDSNPARSLPALQLLLTCMYTEKPIVAAHEVKQMDPEELIHTMEKTSALFDRIKRGYPSEVAMLCSVLPSLLTDFFPPSEMLSKVVGEFLSPQQPHPRLLATVVFQVFERASQQAQLPLLQDWVVFSLSNFTTCSPIAMATWCLTCFFISASPNPWLRALFPHVQSRIGRLEYEDRKLLCVAAADFYNHLRDEKQKQTFVSTFQAAAHMQQTPFSELVACL
ncbi:hypothetical protein R5R35_014313 [Gryllus longicercus]|uniref:Huntingtin n=1 Tax=Gryllus longicercus TaxID=2509291 RepID=A0AAN9VLE0_9ORTH